MVGSYIFLVFKEKMAVNDKNERRKNAMKTELSNSLFTTRLVNPVCNAFFISLGLLILKFRVECFSFKLF